MSNVKQFFIRYEEGANTFDADLVIAQFASSFMGADPNGVACFQNDAEFRRVIPERKAFFERIGFKSAHVLNVDETALDERYTMAKVHWQMIFEKTPGNSQEFRFYITYFLFDPGTGPKVVFYISHDDEQKVMREAGLLPASDQ
jgi:hypothetical protein